jgi:hypothetical protein
MFHYQDFLGCARAQISSIVGSAGMQLVLPIELNGRPLPLSKMILRAEKLAEAGGEDFVLQMQVKGRALAKKDWFGKSDPYMQLCRLRPDGTFDVVYVKFCAFGVLYIGVGVGSGGSVGDCDFTSVCSVF